ncbi:hypothetical protein AB0J71_26355 [Nonomuraea sp. NPDC049637]|uniref:hypothetical protein n=1 Tax=Nonomuraea sp. NPDC049637 TaxID=3154356 RepID=UPI00341F78D1
MRLLSAMLVAGVLTYTGVLIALAGLAAGLGFGLLRKPWSRGRGRGLGLAIGWASWSTLTAGLRTGRPNPTLYG